MNKTVTTDVLIVGAGVTGLTAAALLARQGISAITITKYTSTANTPRAHITNQRTIEVMRDLDIESVVYQTGIIMTEVPDTTYTISLADREFARRRTWGTRTDRLADYTIASPSKMVNIGQHLLEPVIHRRGVELGADIRFLTELLKISQDESGVTAQVQYRPTGDRYEIRAKYVIGADGGRSVVAEQLGFQLEGKSELGYALNAWFEADLTDLVAHRPGVLYFTYQPGREYFFGSGTFLLVKRWNEWVIQFSYDPAVEKLDTREEIIVPRIQTAIGDSSIPVKIRGMNKWQINSLVATEYQRGRAFLAGDAAHQHSPGGGLGSNTSIQDSYNLAWKLAAVLRDEAGPELLETYHAERQPIGKKVVDRATWIVGISAEISSRVGIRAHQSKEEGQAALDLMFAPTPEGETLRSELNAALDRLDHGWHEHGFEMGQRYEEGALLDDGTRWPTPEKDPYLFYQATSHPGSHLPHAWLEHDKGKAISTLDLIPAGEWGVITGPGGDGWVEAAKIASKELGIPLSAVTIGPGLDYEDPHAEWFKVREIGDSGALLIRPDRFVAWRAWSCDDNAVSVLGSALRTLLRRTASSHGEA